MKKFDSSQSGQATTEMVFMLLGFAMLLLGLIFTLSLELYNTRVLMDSKFETERSVNLASSVNFGGAGREIREWRYDDDLPFTLKDEAVYREGGEVSEGWTRLGEPDASQADNYTYEWVQLKGFSQGKFEADYKESTQSAYAAANLITKQGELRGRNITARLPELYTAFAKLLNLRINLDKLRNNPSNRVFLPANGEL